MDTQNQIFVVDDDAGLRKSMCLILESANLAPVPFASAESFLEAYNGSQSGCIILDLSMPGMSGMELVRHLRDKGMQIPVIIVSGTGTVTTAVEALKLGVIDFLEKPVDPRIVVSKVQHALAKAALDRSSAEEVTAMQKRLEALTARESELLELIIAGRSNKQIAADLGISIKTVANHRASLMDKVGALNAADLVRISMLAKSNPPSQKT